MREFYAGCDVGSTTGKAVVLDRRGLVATALIPSALDPEVTARRALNAAMAQMNDARDISKLGYVIGTGYGRAEVPFADENISEITCHAVGAFHCDPEIRTVLDIGGQDVKAIGLTEEGTVREFAMNDKCAAGTGRFFEAMARIFECDLDELSHLSLKARRAIPITSQCSVFAETEVVSLISRRRAPEDIAAGIQAAVAKRVYGLVRRVGLEPKLTITGGCAKNEGLIRTLERILRQEITRLDVDSQLIGALGAAIIARKKCTAGT